MQRVEGTRENVPIPAAGFLGGGMAFRGLFVGVDSYDSSFTRLRFAKRDAAVLSALFSDNCGGKSTLLLDGDATKARFVTELRHLAEVSTDHDFVVITFSGHGMRGGALAACDVLPDDPDAGALSLDELGRLTRAIRARCLLLVLDCCFSGNAADKVLNIPQIDYTSRDGSASATRKLDELRGRGYVVIAASDRDQEAFEDPSVRHGLLTHYLIKGLLGHADTVDGGKVHILKLAHYVSMSVSSHGRHLLQKIQEPILGGSLSNFCLDVFAKGDRYRETVDGARPNTANADFASLAPYRIPAPVLDVWRSRIKKLNQLQLDAINGGALLEGMNVLVSAPTSSGKTMVGELSALRAVAQGKKAVFLLPTRALVNEQYEKFREDYHPLGVRTIRATGELRDHMPELIKGDFDLAVLTYEKFVGLLPRSPGLLNVGVLVIDEIQSLMSAERGPLLETLLTWLRVREGLTDTPQIVGLSAVLGRPRELARWLGANLVTGTRRDVPLLEGVMGPDGRHRYRDQTGRESAEQLLEPEITTGFETAGSVAGDRLAHLVGRLVAQGQQVIVFRSTRGRARDLAGKLAHTLGLPPARRVLAALTGGDGGRTTDLLRACLKHGVAFHIADLTAAERQLVEQSFRSPESEVRVLVATTTLSQGVNLPADSVVITDLEHPSADGQPYSVSEYKNMAGRAGRTGRGKQLGRAVILARGSADADHKWQRYVQGDPEPVGSALLHPATDLRAVILAGLAEPAALARGRSGPDVERFLAATFAAHLSRHRGTAHPFPTADILRMVDELIAGGFLLGTPSGAETLPHGLALTELGALTVRSGLGVDSVTAVAQALRAVPEDRLNGATLICAAQLMSELEDVRFQQLPKRRPYGEYDRLAGELRRRGVGAEVLARLMGTRSKNGVSIGRARRSLACLMWTEGIRLADIERGIGDREKTTRPDIPGPVQHAVQRAADVIGTVIEIADRIHPAADLGSMPDILPHQLELGIVAGLVPIAWHVRTPLHRHVYIDLAREGLTSPADILAADPQLLLDCVGGDAERRQVVQEAAAAAWGDPDGGGLLAPLTPTD
ncbi:DEAD/DEAH box helicase [Streptomyces sp. NPDC014748]|uniref:DEAD/DEAH box helicase n=1 Tax=Streptomyces sp. NPDC014748 TaxID=3364905 RepID=UPI0036FFFC6B